METTAGVWQQSSFICSATDNFQHTQNPFVRSLFVLFLLNVFRSSLARIDKRTVRAARNTHYHYNQNSPLDHKMADNCVSLARTNTVSSTITKPIKT